MGGAGELFFLKGERVAVAEIVRRSSAKRVQAGASPARYSDADVLQRFWDKVAVSENSDSCWLWTAARERAGYGAFKVRGEKIGAHVFSWEVFHQQSVADGLIVMHACDNPPCVNPVHLEAGTYGKNNRDAYVRGLKEPTRHTLAPCGTGSAYRRGCRCAACRNAQRIRCARQRVSRRVKQTTAE